MKIKGFVICAAGKLVDVRLSEDIVAATSVEQATAIFETAEQAEEAALASSCPWSAHTIEIRHVEFDIGALHHEVVYEDADDE